MKNIHIETERLILRRFREKDLDDLYEYLSDEEVVRFEPYRPMSLDEVRENLSWRIGAEEMIAVEDKATGKLLGNLLRGKAVDPRCECRHCVSPLVRFDLRDNHIKSLESC